VEQDRKHQYWDLTRRVIGCAITVHKMLGPGFKESVYKKAMTLELPLEYKARSALDNGDLCQGINNLEASGFEIGLLLNFGGEKPQFRRLYNNRGLGR